MNPGHYYCHVPGCPRPTVLFRAVNNLSSIVHHWKSHGRRNFDESVPVVMFRYEHLGKLNVNEGNIEQMASDL